MPATAAPPILAADGTPLKHGQRATANIPKHGGEIRVRIEIIGATGRVAVRRLLPDNGILAGMIFVNASDVIRVEPQATPNPKGECQ